MKITSDGIFRYEIRECAWRILKNLILLLCILSSLEVFAQTEVTGLVSDIDGQPLSGVSVVVKGTSIKTVTDKEGKYIVNVPRQNTILVFSFIGMSPQEHLISDRSRLDVTLEQQATAMEEVVVVGYGEQTKATLTGSVSTVTADRLENRPVSNLANALQGTMSGFNMTRTGGQPGEEGIAIQVRGETSANGAVAPLLIVDGVISPIVTLQTLNVNDVENISVLKDGASAAIYGAQAAGGVILVTTKKGAGAISVEYTNLTGIDWAMNIPDRPTLLEEVEYSNLAQTNAGFPAEYSEWEIGNILEGLEYVDHPTAPNNAYYYNTKPLISEILRKYDFTQNHNISLKGGTKDMNYFLSLGKYRQNGIFKVGPDGLDRYNGRFNVGTILHKYLLFDANLSYSLHKQEAPYTGSSGLGLLFETFRYRQRYPLFTPEGRYNGYGTNNVYARLKEGGYNNFDRNFFDGVFSFRVPNLVKGLVIRGIYGVQYRTEERDRFLRTVELWGRIAPISYINNPNQYQVTNGIIKNNNVQFLVNYDFSVNNKHRFTLLGGYQWQDSRSESVFTTARNLISNDIPSLNLGDNATKVATETINTYAYQSVFARINYNFQQKYLIEAVLRADESSRLAPGNRLKVFPGVSAGWNVHMENWFRNAIPLVSTFKPRFSYGQLGSATGIGNYTYMDLLDNTNTLIFGSPETQATYFYQSTVASNSLSWETVETYNGGLDLSFFKNKLSSTFDYYVKYNNNMLTPQVLPATFGIGAPRINNGRLKTWGWDLDVKYQGSGKGTFSYHVGFNLSDNDNKLLSYFGQKVITPGYVSVLEGYPLRTLWGYQTAGYFSSQEEVNEHAFQHALTGPGDVKYVNVDGDDRISAGEGTPDNHGDLVLLGTTQQRLLFGVNGGVSWKGIDFSLFLQGVGKRMFYPSARALQPMMYRNEQIFTIHLDYWTPENPNAAFPRPYAMGNHNFLPADRWMLNGQYIRLKNIQLGYTLPPSLLNKVKLSKLRIFVTGQDLLTFDRLGIYSNILNPETQDTGNSGADYPFFATVSAGINVSF